jgi:hypothetical protein
MSLLLVYHDARRAVVCTDDRAVRFENGEAIAMPDRVPKFIACGALIFAALGMSDVCKRLSDGTRRMLADHPELGVEQLSLILPPGLQRAWERRVQDPNTPLSYDNLESAIIGYDREARRMRSFVFTAGDGFKPVETTADPYNRIFALGAYDVTDKPILERLTQRMHVADRNGLPWIAAQLRSSLHELHEKYPVPVGEPSFFAALDARGLTDLPVEFPLPPAQVEVASAAAHYMTWIKHLATTNKQDAFSGTSRFFVGSVTTPSAGAPDTTGNNDGGTGAQYGELRKYFFSYATFQSIAPGGNGVVGNQGNLIDGNLADSASYTVTGNGSAANVAQSSLNQVALPVSTRPSSITAKILYDVSTNTLNGTVGPSRFNIDITYIPAGGGAAVHNNVVIITAGTTQAKTVASVSIPVGASSIGFNITAQTLSADTAGQLVAHCYEFWVEAVE